MVSVICGRESSQSQAYWKCHKKLTVMVRDSKIPGTRRRVKVQRMEESL